MEVGVGAGMGVGVVMVVVVVVVVVMSCIHGVVKSRENVLYWQRIFHPYT